MILNKLISSLILMIIYFQSLNAQCTRFYTVQPGDSCESITINLRVSLLTLVRLNPTINCAVLTPGSRLCYFVQVNVVPSPLCTNFYITNVRDTCEILGIVFELPRQTLLNINQNLDCSNLVVGTRLVFEHHKPIRLYLLHNALIFIGFQRQIHVKSLAVHLELPLRLLGIKHWFKM